MDGQARRERIIELLQTKKEPIAGSRIAKLMGVSRQVIVQDIALLRTVYPILATAQGYILYENRGLLAKRAFVVKHDEKDIADELNIIVDAGGKNLSVSVEHDVYGQINADLVVSNRKEVAEFCKKLSQSHAAPLSLLTKGVHIHMVEADTEETLDYIENQLKEKNYLICE